MNTAVLSSLQLSTDTGDWKAYSKMKSISLKTPVTSVVLVILATMLTLSAVVLTREIGGSEPVVFISPSSIVVRINQTLLVSIDVSGVSDLYGWEFKLGWNTSLLELVNITEGSFLSGSRDTYFVPKVMSTDGYVLVGCTALRNVVGVDGNGTLATVEFRAKTLGSCTLGLYDTKLVNSAKQLMEHSEIDGTVTASGTCVIRVQYLDGYPRSDADVCIRIPFQMIGTTNASGQLQCDLSNGDYMIYAVYSGSQFGSDVYLGVPGSATITANYEITPPIVTVLSPQNQTFDGRLVPLNFTIYDYSTISWMGYSLDGQANATVTGNITLNVDKGSHSVVVYANDTYGNMGSSDAVHFSSLGGCVVIRVQYLDGNPRSNCEVIKFEPSPDVDLGTTGEDGNTTTYGRLSPGEYAVAAYYPSGSSNQFGPDTSLIVDSNGNGYNIITNHFLEITPPAISVLSPQNLTYANTSVPLTFTVYDYSPISWVGYSLDNQYNTTIAGNITMSVEDGAHGIVVYTNDTFGNMGSSQTIYFSVDTVSPTVMVSSPQNTTYASASVPLTFAVSEPAPWMGYSLDGQANVTITGNTTLAGLSNGSHSIVVYAVDAAGNMGSSAIISFVVDAASSNGGGGRMPYMD